MYFWTKTLKKNPRWKSTKRLSKRASDSALEYLKKRTQHRWKYSWCHQQERFHDLDLKRMACKSKRSDSMIQWIYWEDSFWILQSENAREIGTLSDFSEATASSRRDRSRGKMKPFGKKLKTDPCTASIRRKCRKSLSCSNADARKVMKDATKVNPVEGFYFSS